MYKMVNQILNSNADIEDVRGANKLNMLDTCLSHKELYRHEHVIR
jgi:hypothetical protein